MSRPMRFGILVLLSLLLAGVASLPVSAQPAPGLAAAAGFSAAPATIGYIVMPGDTLASIAARFGTTVTAILAANPQISNPNQIYIGQRLQIPVAGGPSAQRISFAPGTTSATRDGSVAAGAARRYVFGAAAGQVAQIDAFSNGGSALLAIYGSDGRVVLSKNAGLASFRGPLPTTQDYFVDVYTSAVSPVAYTLQLIIPQRIRFAPGAVSTSLFGAVPGYGTHNYILRAAAGQLLTVNVLSAGQAILIVYGYDGTVLQSDHVGSPSFTGRLPYSEDYFLDVRSVDPAGASYRLDVRITY